MQDRRQDEAKAKVKADQSKIKHKRCTENCHVRKTKETKALHYGITFRAAHFKERGLDVQSLTIQRH